jgi:signal transduction histidine kinase
LQDISETAAERARLKLELDLPGQIPSLSPDVEQCIYRIAQEAIENVINHAQAEKLSVQLTVQDEEISLVVQDDGLGADLHQVEHAGHFGLAGMRERAELVGGSLAIQSKPGQGTRVQLILRGIRT